ncbi:MAG: SPFH domain-containing protein [Alphaproteobacteria bacterium]|nr:SPFH domain-containing protein [Alphaproteobacteria bacterium]
MGILAAVVMTIVIVVVAIIVFWILFWWLYQRATKEVAFVRTGMGGQKVVQNGGAFVIPVLHDVINVTMGTNRLEVSRVETNSIITRDRLRVDVTAEFYVRVGGNRDAIALAAQSLGSKTSQPGAMRDLLEGRFVDALRTIAAEMTMEELHVQRGEYIRRVKELVRPEIEQTGLELESASLTAMDQTNKDFFNPNNAFDAEGLTRLTADIEERRLKRNAIEQDSEISIQKKRLESETRRLELTKEEEYARLGQQQDVAVRRAEQAALISAEEAAKRRESEEARVAADLAIEVANVKAEEAREIEKLNAQKEIERQTQKTRQESEIAAIETELALELRRIERKRDVALQEAETTAETLKIEAEKGRESEEARIAADREIQLARTASSEATSLREIALQSAVETEEQNKRRAVDDAKQDTDKDIRISRIEREKTIALVQAEQSAEIAKAESEKRKEADETVIRATQEIDHLKVEVERDLEAARILAEEEVELAKAAKKESISTANINTQLNVDIKTIEQQQKLSEEEHRRDIAVAKSSKAQIAALADVETARVALVKAESELELVRAQEREERDKIIALIQANTEAERDTVAMLVQAEARFREAQNIAKASEVETKSKSDRVKALAQAEALAEKARLEAEELRNATDAAAVRAMTDAENTMSEELMSLKLRLSVIDHLKDIIRESAKPMENINDIRILQVDGVLGKSGLTGSGDEESRPGGSGTLPDQLVDSALRYRTQAPVVDSLLGELGLSGSDSKAVRGFLNQQLGDKDDGDSEPSDES